MCEVDPTEPNLRIHGVDTMEPADEPKTTDTASPDDWSSFDFSAIKREKTADRTVRALPRRDFMRVLVAGLAGGIAAWLLKMALEAWVIRPLFCGTPDGAAVCVNGAAGAFVASLVIVGLVTLAILAAARMERSLIISVATWASVAALWSLLSSQSWWAGALLTGLFAAGLYLLFTMISTLKNTWIGIVVSALTVLVWWLIVRL
jgi:hypothetical protein